MCVCVYLYAYECTCVNECLYVCILGYILSTDCFCLKDFDILTADGDLIVLVYYW